MATKEEMQGNWDQLVGAVRKKYSQITGDDLERMRGDTTQLAGYISQKTGQARQEVEDFLKSASKTASDTLGQWSEAAGNLASDASGSLRAGYDYAHDLSRDGYKAANETIKHHPVETLAVALGVGLVAGLFAGASMFSRRH